MTILRHAFVSIAALATALVAPASARPNPAGRPGPTTATIDAHPALWVARDADTTIYLFGTVHVLPHDVMWFKGPLKAAFDSADRIVLETDMRDRKAAMQALMAHGYADTDKPFTARMAPADKARYVATVTGFGMPATAFDMLKPWAAAATLSALAQRKAGYDLASGVDVTLADAAKTAGKKVDQLETIDQEFDCFDTLPDAAQLAFLNGTTGDAGTAVGKMKQMIAEWSAGKADALGDDMNASMSAVPEMADALVYRRNEEWARRIAAMLDTPGVVFVSVGSGHLGGPRNLRDDLAALGVTTTRVAD